MNEHISYYYGLNYDSEDAPEAPVRPVGNALAGAVRRDAIGVDGGLWYQNITGMPLDPGKFQIGYGGETKPDTPSDWTSYHTAPEAAGMVLESMFGEPVRAVGRVGSALRGDSPYQVDEINDPKTVGQAQVKDVLEALSLYSGPGVLAGKPALSGVSALGGIGKIGNKFKSAYESTKEVSGGRFVDIAILRDKLGLSQEKMAGLLQNASRKGHAVLELGEPSVVSDYLKGGMVDGNLLVRLEPEFFDNIGSYIKESARKKLSQMESDEIARELLK